jgi:hypothetical protein
MAGLNESVIQAAALLAKNVSSKATEIQTMLLQLIAFIITKKPYVIHRIPLVDTREKPKDKVIEPNQKVGAKLCFEASESLIVLS